MRWLGPDAARMHSGRNWERVYNCRDGIVPAAIFSGGVNGIWQHGGIATGASKHIRACDGMRAARLEAAGPPDALAQELQCALHKAMVRCDIRLAVDSKHNRFVEQRAIVQFPVARETYDWFFNARTGYRGQFWLGPDIGMAFNRRIVKLLSGILSQYWPKRYARDTSMFWLTMVREMRATTAWASFLAI